MINLKIKLDCTKEDLVEALRLGESEVDVTIGSGIEDEDTLKYYEKSREILNQLIGAIQ